MVGFKYRIIFAFKFADKPFITALFFKSLLDETVRRYSRVDLVLGDWGFCQGIIVIWWQGRVARFYPKGIFVCNKKTTGHNE
jgi:hypothetical protein